MLKTLSLVAAFVGCAAILSAQAVTADADTYKVNYFANANTSSAPDGTVYITDVGTSSPNGGNLCADIFVFDPSQELTECCGCKLTPDGLRTLSVNTNLTANPLTGVILTTGVIKVLSATVVSGGCPMPTAPKVSPGLRAWGTHIQNANFAITETDFQDAGLSAAELARLGSECSAIVEVGSGKGRCSCGSGD